MITLAMDASTYRGTVAVFAGDRLRSENSAAMRGRDSELLMPALDAALRAAGLSLDAVERIVCGAGPGSFTSLRIAASLAKGLAIGRGVPLYEVSSLALVVAANVAGAGSGQRYLVRLEALRGESYVAEFEHHSGVVRLTKDVQRVATDRVSAAAGAGVLVVGPDEPEPWHPHVRGLPLVSEMVFRQPVNLAAWEPAYGRLAEAQVKWETTHGRALQS